MPKKQLKMTFRAKNKERLLKITFYAQKKERLLLEKLKTIANDVFLPRKKDY